MAIDRRHDLRHDDPSCILLAQEHQLTGQRGAAHERNAGVDHVWVEIARLLDESRRGPISGDHDYRFYWEALPFELLDRLVHIHGVALVIEPQNCALVAPP